MAIAEIVFSGFVSKALNDAVDISKDKINKAIKDKENKHQSLESQIYNVTVDVFNQITNNQYKNNQDKIYEAAENLLKGYINNKEDDIEVIRSSLKLFYPDVDNDKCMEFRKLLYQELSKEVYGALYREIRLLQEEQESRKTTRIEQKVDEIISGLDDLKSNSQMQNIPQNNVPKQKVKSRTQEYADKWNANMFLNDFDKRDKNPGVNVKLKDVYLEFHLPHYIWGNNPEDEPSTDLKVLLSEYIDENSGNKMLLILGQPGIGKSTLITWITANFTNKVDDIMVYQFASDLKDIDWQKANISTVIFDVLNLSYDDLDGKTLILDGLDEISVGNRKEILDEIYWELIKGRNVERFSLIITCRENYINSFERIQCKYITLLPWDEEQIRSFCLCFQEKTNRAISEHTIKRVVENEQILGIPLILYMTLALNITIEKEGSIVDIYDSIFSLEGGIYDRCIENKNFADVHRIGEIKEQIHQISREIAIWMFENNPDEAYIPQGEYEKICDGIIKAQRIENKDIQQDFLIGNFFKLKHCEGVGTEKLYFVHRSIYEYFVAETIYSSIENALIELTQESQLDLAGKIAFYLKEGEISPTIGEYLQHKIIKLYNGLIIEKKQIFFQWWESTVEKMMEVGMFYYTKKNIQIYPNIIAKEVQCFINLVEVLRLLIDISDNKYILTSINNKVKEKYIRYCSMKFGCSNLSRVYLSNVNLSKVNLCSVNLNNSYLYKVNLFGAYLSNAKLNGAYLEEIDLREADLNGSSLEGARLKKVDLRRTYFNEAVLQRDDIQNILPHIKTSLFSFIIIKDQDEMKEVGRSELFPEESILLAEERNFNKDGAYNQGFI